MPAGRAGLSLKIDSVKPGQKINSRASQIDRRIHSEFKIFKYLSSLNRRILARTDGRLTDICSFHKLKVSSRTPGFDKWK